jgi:hypothetical protein
MTKPTQPAPTRERFKRRGRRLVVSARITLDPQQDAGLIALLREAERHGMASLIRTALRTCYPADWPPQAGSANPQIELLDGHVGVILSDQSVTADRERQQVVIYCTDIQRVITELTIAQSRLMSRSVTIPAGVTLPLAADAQAIGRTPCPRRNNENNF